MSFDKNANYSLNSLTVNDLTLIRAFKGRLEVQGTFEVTENAVFQSNVYFQKNVDVTKDLTTLNLKATGFTEAEEVVINGNLLVKGYRIAQYQNIDISGNLTVYDTVHFGSTNAYMYSTSQQNVGVNKRNATSTLDISGVNTRSLNVFSAQPRTLNILSRNNQNKGLSVFSNTNSTQIGFYSNNTISENQVEISLQSNIAPPPDAKIQYDSSGILTIDVSKNMNILSKVSISPNINPTVDHPFNETMVVYSDSNTAPYLWKSLEQTAVSTSDSVTLVSTDNSTNTFLNIITPNKQGMAVGGGKYTNDTTRSFGTVGLVDSNGEYYPSLNIVEGDNNVKRKFTIGINTHAPGIDQYAVDMNGPLRITNGEHIVATRTPFEITRMQFSRTMPNYAIAVGTPTNLNRNIFDFRYAYSIIYTQDYGNSWKTSNTTIQTRNFTKINDVCIFDSSLSMIVGNNGLVYYTNAVVNNIGGAYWYPFLIIYINSIGDVGNYGSIFINSNRRIFISDENKIIYMDIDNRTHIESNLYTDINGIVAAFDADERQFYVPLITNITQIRGYNDRLYIIGEHHILKYNNVNTDTPSYQYSHIAYDTSVVYKSIFIYDANLVVVVGDRIISYTTNGGVNWIDVPTVFALNSVYVYSNMISMAVGDNGVLLYSQDGNATWNVVSSDILNTSGISSLLVDSSYNLTHIQMHDINTFMITKTVRPYIEPNGYTPGNTITDPNIIGQFGNSSVIYSTYPYLLNNVHNFVLDVSGSSQFSGDLNIYNEGKIDSTNNTFYLLNNHVETIYFGNDASSIVIANLVDSVSKINHDFLVLHNSHLNGTLVVDGNVRFNQQLYVEGDTTMHSNVYVHQNEFIDKSLYVIEDVSLGRHLTVGQNSKMYGYLVVDGNTTVYSNLTAWGNTYCLDELRVYHDAMFYQKMFVDGNVLMRSNARVLGNVSIESNLDVSQNTGIYGNLYVSGNTDVSSNLRVDIDTSIGRDLYVHRNTGIRGNLDVSQNTAIYGNTWILGNTDVSSNLRVDIDTSIGRDLLTQRNTRIGGTLDVSQNTTIYGNTWIWGNTDVSSNLRVDIDTSIGRDLHVQRNTRIDGTLDVSGNTRASSNLTVIGDASMGGNLTISKTSRLKGNVTVDVFLTTPLLDVTTTANINTLNVSNDATFSKNAYLNYNTQISGGFSIYSNMSKFYGNVNVDSDSVFNANLNIKQDTSIDNRLYVANDTYLSGNLFIQKDASMNSNLYVNNTATINRDLTVNRNTDISNNLRVGSDTILSGNLDVNKDISANGNVSINKTLRTFYYDSYAYGGNIYIGYNTYDFTPGFRDIYISGGSSYLPQNNIYVGSRLDNVEIAGTSITIGNIANNSVKIPKISTGNLYINPIQSAGLHFGIETDTTPGFIKFSPNKNGYLLNVPNYNKIVNVDVDSMSQLLPEIKNGLVTLMPTPSDPYSNFKMGVATIDVSNILLKNYSASNIPMNIQIIDTSLGILGNAYVLKNMAIGKSTADSNISLDIIGNISQKGGGYIHQF